MENIKKWFEFNYIDCNISELDTQLQAQTNTITYLIVKPHSGTNNKWLLRISTVSAFDRWANSTAIEKIFDTEAEVCEYLNNYQLYIYRELLEYLSSEYDELENSLN